MANKETKDTKMQNRYRTSHLSEDEKDLAVTLYEIGINFDRCTPSEAVDWHREVAEKGWALAQYSLLAVMPMGTVYKKI